MFRHRPCGGSAADRRLQRPDGHPASVAFNLLAEVAALFRASSAARQRCQRCTAARLSVVFLHSAESAGSTMPIFNDIAAALDREADELQMDLGDRMVEDSLDEAGLRTVLLFESPGNDEVSHGHPLAGHSGRQVTKAFSCYHPDFAALNEPIGCLLRRLHDGDTVEQLSDVALRSLNSLGLMNVSLLPLQSTAYCLDVRVSYNDLLCYFEAIKTTLDRKKKVAKGVEYLRNLNADLPSSQVYEALRDDLIHRLPQGQDVVVVPCGMVASAFYFWATLGANDQIPNDFVFVPHPSRGWWTHTTYRETIRTLVEQVHERAA